MITKIINADPAHGPAGDFASPQEALAAFGVAGDLPLTLADHVTFDVYYSGADENNVFPGAWVFPNIVENSKKLLFKGMYGSALLGTAPKMLVTSGNYGFDLHNWAGGGLHNPVWENIELDATVATYGVRHQDQTGYGCAFRKCYLHGTAGVFLYLGDYFSIKDCFVIATSSSSVISKVYNGNNSIIRNSIIANLHATGYATLDGPSSRIRNCTIYSAGTTSAAIALSWPSTPQFIFDSIVQGGHGALLIPVCQDFSYQRMMIEAMENNCFYSAFGTMSNGNSLLQYFNSLTAEELAAAEISEANPLLVNPGGTTLADYALQANSPCRALQKTALASVLYPAQNRERRTMGACPYDVANALILVAAGGSYSPDFPNSANVLENDTTDGVPGQVLLDDLLSTASPTPGNWVKANKVYVLVDHNFGVSGSEVAELQPDFPTPNHVTENDTTDEEPGLIPLADVSIDSGGSFDKLVWEAGRNTAPLTSNLRLGTSCLVQNVTVTGDVRVPLPIRVQKDFMYDTQDSVAGTFDPTGSAPNKLTITYDDQEDGTTTIATITNSTAGATNSIKYAELGTGETWHETTTITGNGTITITHAKGSFVGIGKSVSAGGTTEAEPGLFDITDGTIRVAWYRVLDVPKVPGTGYKVALLSRIERPVTP